MIAAIARRGAVSLLIAGAAAYAWWATGLEPFSVGASWGVLGAGLTAMLVARAGRRAPRERPPFRGTAPWAVLVLATAGWQLAAYVQHPRSDHPTLSSLLNDAIDPRPLRAGAFVAWLLAAGWLARR